MVQSNDLEVTKNLKQDYLYVNAYPDNEYPLRILEAYLSSAEDASYWIGAGSEYATVMAKVMNEAQSERAIILRKAYETMRREINKPQWSNTVANVKGCVLPASQVEKLSLLIGYVDWDSGHEDGWVWLWVSGKQEGSPIRVKVAEEYLQTCK